MTAVIGPDMPDEPVPGVRGCAVPASDPLAREWVVVVVAPHFAGALAAMDAPAGVQQGRPPAVNDASVPASGAVEPIEQVSTRSDEPRRLDYVLTYDRDRVMEAAAVLLRRVRPVRTATAGAGERSDPPVTGTTPSASTAAAAARPVAILETAAPPGPGHAMTAGFGVGPVVADVLARALSTATNCIVVADMRAEDHPLVYVNEAFLRLTGYSAREVLGNNCRLLQGPDTDETSARPIGLRLAAGRPVDTVLLNYRRDGTTFWNELHLWPVRDSTGELTHYVGNQFDVTDRVQREQHTIQRAHLDDLTGLPNRSHVLDHWISSCIAPHATAPPSPPSCWISTTSRS